MTLDDTTIRVLVVENDSKKREDHVKTLILWNYHPITAEGKGTALLDDARMKTRRHNCQVALIDMRLFDDYDPYDTSGLDLVSSLQPTVSIIVSGFGNRPLTRKALRDKGAFDFIGKQESPEELKQTIEAALREFYQFHRDNVDIVWPPGLSANAIVNRLKNDIDPVPNEAESVLMRLFPQAQMLWIQDQRHTNQTQDQDLPRQRSLVLHVRADNHQPVIVKLARPDKIKQEIERYRLHVENRLVGGYYARPVVSAVSWSLGGAIYNFIGGIGLGQPRLFSDAYTQGTSDHITKCLKRLLDTDGIWSALYHDTLRPEMKSLFKLYTDVWGEGWYKRLKSFPNQELERSYPYVLHEPLPNPISWLYKHIGLDGSGHDASTLPDTFSAVTHGDLFGDNFFVNDDAQVWVIDYERTGRGPILQDFVQLEADIATRLFGVQEDNIAALLDLLKITLSPQVINTTLHSQSSSPEMHKALDAIGALRSIAQRQTRINDAQQYYWGLLFNAVFRATLFPNKDSALRERALLFGSLICHRLDHWEHPWPPQNW